MKLSGEHFIGNGGEIYCHIFENLSQGIQRGLFWSITVDFRSIQIGSNACSCSATSDWIQWPIRTWLDLDNRSTDFRYGENGRESSLYLYTHHAVDSTRLTLTREEKNRFATSLTMEVHLPNNLGVEVEHPLLIQTNAVIPFTGLLIVPENLGYETVDKSTLQDIAGQFVNLESFHAPEPYASGFRFRPIFRSVE